MSSGARNEASRPGGTTVSPPGFRRSPAIFATVFELPTPIEHVRLAIAKSERFRSFAAGDSDFDPIRDEPAFQALVKPRLPAPAAD